MPSVTQRACLFDQSINMLRASTQGSYLKQSSSLIVHCAPPLPRCKGHGSYSPLSLSPTSFLLGPHQEMSGTVLPVGTLSLGLTPPSVHRRLYLLLFRIELLKGLWHTLCLSFSPSISGTHSSQNVFSTSPQRPPLSRSSGT